MSKAFYTQDEIDSFECTGQVRICRFELKVGSNPSKYYVEDVQGSVVYFVDDEEGKAEDKLLDYIADMRRWYALGHEGLELEDGQWLEYHIRRFTAYEGGVIDFGNPFGHFSSTFEEIPF